MIKSNRNSGSLMVVLCLLSSAFVQAQSFGTFEIKAKTGDPIPGTSQTLRLSTLSTPDISQGGTLAFFARTEQSTGTIALYSLGGPDQSTLARHIAEQQSTPSSDGRVDFFDRVFLADDGTLSALVSLENITAGGRRAVYRTTGSQVLNEELREGKPIATGLPTICRIAGLSENGLHRERNGDLWFLPSITTSSSGEGCNGRRALYRLSNTGVASTMVSLGAPVSGTAAIVTNFDSIVGNDEGSIFFRGRDSASSSSFWYLLRGSTVLRIAPRVTADVYAGADETLTFVGGTTATQYRGGSMSGVEVLRRGQNLPQGQGQFFSIRDADVAADNVVVATMALTGTAGGSSDDSGVYLADSQGVVEIAREGMPAIAANSTFRSFPDFTEFANVGLGGRVLFEARYAVGSNTIRGWFYYDRENGLREILNGSTMIQGLQVRGWTVGQGFNQRGELPMVLTLSDFNDYMVLYRLPGTTSPPPPPPSFAIIPGITGAWFDPEQSGHGLFVEVLPNDRMLAWWFTFDAQGNQAWFGGVGPYTGDVATIPFTRTAGGRFIPNFDPALITNPPWGTATIRFSSCNRGLIEYVSASPGFGTGSMELTRLSLPAGLTCPL